MSVPSPARRPTPDAAPARRPDEDMTAPAQAPTRGTSRWTGRWTTRRWLTTGVCVSLLLLTALSALGAWVLTHSTQINTRLVDHSSPALIASVRLESALVNQETGVRGYELTGDSAFLEPYRSGLRDQTRAGATLRQALGDDRRSAADLDLVLARADSWRAQYVRPIVTAPAGRPVPADPARALASKASFDSLRSALVTQQRHLETERATARADLQGVRTLRNWVFSTIAVLILALPGMIFIGLRRGITTPLEQLSRDARLVAHGDFTRPVTSEGPADVRKLADDVDAMRRRLVGELSFTEDARTRLDEQAADLRRSNAELEQFAYVASHDLQEPLRKVASFCQLLQRRYAEQLDERAGQYIHFAVDGATRMQTLINDLLDFSRVGRMHNQTATVDLQETFDRTVDSLSIAIEDADARISHDALPVLTGDATQLTMLVQNLLGNALKFRDPERPLRIHLGAERRGDTWHFSVTDSGIGIEPEHTERVFIIFQRLHTRETYGGNGIGLAVCKKIVEFHGGTIAVDPHHAPGARITFTLPALDIPAQAPAPQA
ncbi:ATP-binding protein [Streptomyces sp. NPDC058200]|uniref:sensor histidine kinase n=1 Tax=Streptomyces sp. NPDC058200 TaxID=3346378 RepID=UPI0036E4C761